MHRVIFIFKKLLKLNRHRGDGSNGGMTTSFSVNNRLKNRKKIKFQDFFKYNIIFFKSLFLIFHFLI